MYLNSYSLVRVMNQRADELRKRAADGAVASALDAERRQGRREAALARLKAAAAAREERAIFSWQSQSQRQVLGLRRFRSAR